MDTITVPSIIVPSTEGEAAAVSDGYFSSQPPHAPTNSRYSLNLSPVDLQMPAPPYTPLSHSLFPLPPSSRTAGSTTKLQIPPQSPTRAHRTNNIYNNHTNNNNATSSPITPMSQHSMQSFETAQDLEKGSLKLKLTRSTTYNQLRPFFSRSSEPLDGPALNVSKRRSTIIASSVLTVTILLVIGILFGLMKWFK